MRITTIGIVALLASCGGSPKEPSTPPLAESTTVTDEAPSGEVRLYEGDQLIMALGSDGSLRILTRGDEVVGTLGADNRITVDGHTAALHDDGAVTLDGDPVPFTIGPDASLHGPGMPPARVEPDGTISGQPASARPIRVEGATTPELRRKAMFMLLLLALSTDDVREKEAYEQAGPAPEGGSGDLGGAGSSKKDRASSGDDAPAPPADPAPLPDGAVDDM